jgi:hypothetical protein
MRRILPILALAAAAAAPAVALAGPNAASDGTLSIRNGKGLVAIQARGGVIARWDRGCARVYDPVVGDGSGPIVFGAERIVEVSERAVLYCGANVRLRLIGGHFRFRFTGSDVDLSFVGRGRVTLGPAERILETAGTYSIDEEEYRPFPVVQRTFQLGTQPGE